MALLAFNLTTSPVTLAASNPSGLTLPPSATPGTMGPAVNVTIALSGLQASDYANLQAQAPNTVVYIWTDYVAYTTGVLQTVQPATAASNAAQVVHVSTAGNDANPGTASAPVLTLDRAFTLLSSDIGFCQVINFDLPGTYDRNTQEIFFGHAKGPNAAPLFLQGGFTNELGTQIVTAGSTASTVIASALATIRNGNAASIVAGAPAGQMRITGLTGIVAGDVNRALMIREATNTLNNGTFWIATVNSANSVDVFNPKYPGGTDTSNGAIYWQESYEGALIMFETGTAAGQSRMVRDHGPEVTGAVTFPAKTSTANNNTVFVPDGIGAGVTFEFQVSGGFVPTPGDVTVDISSAGVVTGAQIAAIFNTAVNAQTVAALKTRSANTSGSAVCNLRNLMLGAAGNVPITTSNGAITVSGMSGGLGTPTTTFSVNEALSPATVAGDTFIIQKPATTIRMNNNLPSFDGQGATMYLRGIRFLNGFATPASQTLEFMAGRYYHEGCEYALRGGNMACPGGHGSVELRAGTVVAGEFQSVSDSAIPAGVIRPAELGPTPVAGEQFITPMVLGGGGGGTTRQACGVLIHDTATNGITIQQFHQVQGYWSFRNASFNATSLCFFLFFGLDAKNTTINLGTGAFLQINTNTAGVTPRLVGQQTTAATSGIIEGNAATFRANVGFECRDSGGDGVRLEQGSVSRISGAITGFNNAGVGMRVLTRSVVFAPTGCTVTGASGDIIVSNRAARFWTEGPSNWTSAAPVQNESDPLGDGSKLASTGATAESFLPQILLKAQAGFTGSQSVVDSAALQTLNATPATVKSYALSDNTQYVFKGRVVARDEAGVHFGAWEFIARVFRQGGGGATLGGGGVVVIWSDVAGGTLTSTSATFVVSGNNLILQVTGVAATTIDWVAESIESAGVSLST